MKVWPWLVVFVVLVALGLEFPRYTDKDEADTYAKFTNLYTNLSDSSSRVILFPVMTFNIRHDIPEDNHLNNFTNRIERIDAVIRKWNPLIVGMQEPFKSQITRLTNQLPPHYKPIGYGKLPSLEESKEEEEGEKEQKGKKKQSVENPRKHDFSTAILYNSKFLSLQETDYVWLSTTPRKEDSVDWNTYKPRTLNIARFRYIEEGKEREQNIIAFNTHLDRWSELARRGQAKVVAETIKEWEQKYPDALFLLFGDFNTVPGQMPHKIITSVMEDSWIWCKNHSKDCTSNDFSSSFHGWFGTIANSWVGRIFQAITYTLHGMGVSPPSRHRTLASIISDFIFDAFPITEAIPFFPFNRFHVDWILFKEFGTKFVPPSFVAVVDVKSTHFSSDHFPIVALFGLKKEK